jgi:hypothetical protein
VDAVVASTGQEAVDAGVEEAAARAEDEIDRRAGDACSLGDLLDAYRFGGATRSRA